MIPRSEYPRPDYVREQWLSLNGSWAFAFDDGNEGIRERWYEGDTAFPMTIQVPYAFETKLSGIQITAPHDVVWYQREVDIPEAFSGRTILLRFGAADYVTDVWVEGQHCVRHVGGQTPFFCEIGPCMQSRGKLNIVVRCHDFWKDLTLPRGKQYWKEESESIFYTRTTGIWQSVWMEAVPAERILDFRITPSLEGIGLEVRTNTDGTVRFEIEACGKALGGGELTTELGRGKAGWTLDKALLPDGTDPLWSPENPMLYDIRLTFGEDEVRSYFGLRTVTVENGKLCLNGRPYYLKMLLDQGYWPESTITPPTEEAIVYDIEMSKAMGFNGCRKHQKVEDPRFLYQADRIGFLVWGEAANAYQYSETYAADFTNTWSEIIQRDYSHPCIIAWTPLNESWGVPDIHDDRQQQDHACALYYHIKSLDTTRPVISNDGWDHAKTDLVTIHDYEPEYAVLKERYASLESILSSQPGAHAVLAEGWPYAQQPILVTEFGGISYPKGRKEGWGYSNAKDDDDYAGRYHAVVQALLDSPLIQGFCYTQTTDVEQEINGVMTYDRKPKIAPEVFRAINEGTYRE